ncbi:MAG: M20 family metallo-hydrolase [Dysgonamonadaceae bacterium]|jgi:acetylornithine deacetylase|nr:M20 family metallo-hydrolase [Dysgonamonadaceae bacterium]
MKTDSLFYNAVNLLKQMISIPSFSKEEGNLADFLELYFKKKNHQPERKGNNIWLTSPKWDDEKPVILFNSHIDTVKPVSGWTKNPFTPEETDGKLYGLGSNDAGASVVSLLKAFLILTAQPQPNNFIYLVSCEEEISGKDGIESVLPELPPITCAIVGEPTSMQPAIAEKGLMVLDGVVHGKSGHAARNEGENAIYKALPVISRFQNLEFPLVSDLLGPVKTTVTMIQAGTQHNVIPDSCKFTVDIRTNELYSNEELFDEIQSLCNCEIQARSFRLNSSHISPEHPLVKRAETFGLKPFGSPTLSDQSLLKCPSLKIGPGKSSRSHTADEFILLSEIQDAIHLYVNLLNNLNLRD